MEKNVEEYLNKRAEDTAREWKIRHKILIGEWQLTPIESLFFIEWAYRMNEENRLKCSGNKTLWLYPQYDIVANQKKYRVDFLAQYALDWNPDNIKEMLIIELDSYLWHGKTPKQFEKEKKRERELIQSGYKLMRFSGGEILRNVEECVDQVIKFLEERNKNK